MSKVPKKIGIIFGVLVIMGAVGYLLFGKLEKTLVYFLTPTELLAQGEQAYDHPLRLGGMVKKGSLRWDPETIDLQFLLTDGKREVWVESRQTPPQMFQEEMGVVVEGKFDSNVFVADRLMVKHSNQYHPPQEGEKPAILYKDLVQ